MNRLIHHLLSMDYDGVWLIDKWLDATWQLMKPFVICGGIIFWLLLLIGRIG